MRRHPRPPLGHPGIGHPNLGPMRPLRGPPPPYLGGPRGPSMGMPPLPGMAPPPGALSSCTNSNDPASMDSRLFVGNLNTVALSKEDVDAIFSRYGVVAGISVHKGYAFVQFRHPDEARRAGASEDGKTYEGQAFDINIVSQPKNRNALKRTTAGRPINDTPTPKKSRADNPGTNQSLQRTLVTLSSGNMETNKKMNLTTVNNAVNKALATATKKTISKPVPLMKEDPVISKSSPAPVSKPALAKVAANSDVLICGVCKMQFSSLHSLAQHKKVPCRLKFTCQCQDNPPLSSTATGEPSVLLCAKCDAKFNSAWALCQHYDQEHKLSIFKSEEDQNLTDTTEMKQDQEEMNSTEASDETAAV